MSISNVQSQTSSELINPLIKEIETKPVVGTIIEKEISQTLSPLKKFNSVNAEVKVKKQSVPRRSFDVGYKTRVLAEYDACESVMARGALLRPRRSVLFAYCCMETSTGAR